MKFPLIFSRPPFFSRPHFSLFSNFSELNKFTSPPRREGLTKIWRQCFFSVSVYLSCQSHLWFSYNDWLPSFILITLTYVTRSTSGLHIPFSFFFFKHSVAPNKTFNNNNSLKCYTCPFHKWSFPHWKTHWWWLNIDELFLCSAFWVRGVWPIHRPHSLRW